MHFRVLNLFSERIHAFLDTYCGIKGPFVIGCRKPNRSEEKKKIARKKSCAAFNYGRLLGCIEIVQISMVLFLVILTGWKRVCKKSEQLTFLTLNVVKFGSKHFFHPHSIPKTISALE